MRSALPPQSLPWPLPQCLSPTSPVWPQAGWALGPATRNLHTCIIRDVRENYLGTWQAAGKTSRRIQTGTSATADVRSLAKRNHGGGLSTRHLPFTTTDTVKPPTHQVFFPQVSPVLTPTLTTVLRCSILSTHQKQPKA